MTTRKIDDGGGRPDYWTAEQLARVIVYLSQYAPVNLPDDTLDCVAWACALRTNERTSDGT